MTDREWFWLLLILHGGLIAGELYLAYRAKWIG